MAEPYGAVALVFHSHLPYVLSHDRLEEEWLFEAVAESYLPLLQTFSRLILHGVSPKITLGLTPVLLEQFADPQFSQNFLAYLERKSRAAQEDRLTFKEKNEDPLARLAGLWGEFYRRAAAFFADNISADLIGALRRLQAEGHVELIASAATHAYLPLLGLDESVRAQIEIGTVYYQRHFGTRPQGFWLPEFAYRPAYHWTPPVEGIEGLLPSDRQAVDQILSASGIRYFIVDTRQLKGSPPDYERHSPSRLHWVDGRGTSFPSPTVAVFSRDFEITSRVWQHDTGYPGDPWYLEFHKKHAAGGLRYWRITDRQADLAYKHPYVPERAFAQVSDHAAHFAQVLRESLRTNWELTGERGIIVAAFDAELFGHWWFEGPQWLYELLWHIAADTDIALTTCGDYLLHHPPQRTVQLIESSWGEGGDHRNWLYEDTHWLWRNLYQAECDMQRLGERANGKKLDKQLARTLRQCCRELLLLQASDWPFMISTWNARDHAERRASFHFNDFQRFRHMAERYIAGEAIAEEDWRFLDEMERHNSFFRDLDLNVFWGGKYQVEEDTAPRQEAEQSPRPRQVQRRASKKGRKG
jgi:1,4-alpha-glucan branching enzyme